MPQDPTSRSDYTVQFSVLNVNLTCAIELRLDDALLASFDPNVPNDPVVFSVDVVNVSEGPHSLRLAVTACFGGAVTSLAYSWTRLFNYIDLAVVSPLGPRVFVDGKLDVLVDELGSIVYLAFVIPLQPAPGETLRIACSCNDSSLALLSKDKFVLDATNYNVSSAVSFQITGVSDTQNDETMFSLFSVGCGIASSGDALIPRYANGSVRSIAGRSQNIVWPLFQDVLVRNDFGQWKSSLLTSGFSLTLSKNVTALLIGDSIFRCRGSTHFEFNVSVRVGSVPATVVRIISDVRPILRALEPPMDWPAPLDGIEVVFPSYYSSCGNDGAACTGTSAYKQIVVQNPGGGTAACPPSCPGSTEVALGASGAFYTSSCVGYPTDASCIEAATASTCAFGVGDTCRPCPVGAICPGGQRAW